MGIVPIYNEFIDFLAGGYTPQQIIDYRPSKTLESKVLELIGKKKNDNLTESEQSELNYSDYNGLQ